MKKILLLFLVLGTFSLTSCRSGWSCKKRYAKNRVKDAQDALEAHLEKIAFLQEQYDSLDA